METTESVEINHKELKQFIDEVWKHKLALNLTGTTGIGKSRSIIDRAKSIAKAEEREFIDWNRVSKDKKDEVIENPDKYFVFIDIRLSQFDATDLKGLPKLDQHAKVVEWLVQNWLYCISNEKIKGFVFFDERNLAPPSVQASCYQIIHDRCMGDVKIGDNVALFSAGNTQEDKANVYDMAKPLCNRFIHATLLVPHTDDWIDWAIKHGIDSRIIAYLRFKPNHLFDFRPESPENAFPTPRAWAEFVNPLIQDKDYTHPLFQKLMASAVGSGVAQTFTAFQSLKQQINFQDILDNPKNIRKIDRNDLQFSLIGIIGNWFDKNYKKADCDKLFEMVAEMQPEFAILTIKIGKEKHVTELRKCAATNKIWKNKLAVEYGKFLREA